MLSPSKILFYSYTWTVWLPSPPCPYPDLGHSETFFVLVIFVYSNFFWSGAETTLYYCVILRKVVEAGKWVDMWDVYNKALNF